MTTSPRAEKQPNVQSKKEQERRFLDGVRTKISGLRGSLFLWRGFYLVGDHNYIHHQDKINSDKTVTLVGERYGYETNTEPTPTPTKHLGGLSHALHLHSNRGRTYLCSNRCCESCMHHRSFLCDCGSLDRFLLHRFLN